VCLEINIYIYIKDITEFIAAHWERLCYGRTPSQTWKNTVSASITTHPHIFRQGQGPYTAGSGGQKGWWGLHSWQNPLHFSPSFQSQFGEERGQQRQRQRQQKQKQKREQNEKKEQERDSPTSTFSTSVDSNSTREEPSNPPPLSTKLNSEKIHIHNHKKTLEE
jgi:hypothetical protein